MTNSAPNMGGLGPEHARRLGTSTASQQMQPVVDLAATDLTKVEMKLEELLHSSIAIIPQVGGHLTFAGGKRLRPLLTLLCAQASGYHDPARITIAAVGELLHSATLLHDDVIDHGEYRRGRPAARLPYGNGMAVLTGDFCLARGLQAVAAIGNMRAVRTMADTVTRMAEGEIAQLHSAGDWHADRDRYYMVIERKTAALLAWCSSVAGLLDDTDGQALFSYGLELGYAFQLVDDVLDYAGDDALGKEGGQDLREGRATLPLILACERDPALVGAFSAALKGGPPADEDRIREIRTAVARSGALEQSLAIASTHSEKAARHLGGLPKSPAKTALATLADYVVHRPL